MNSLVKLNTLPLFLLLFSLVATEATANEKRVLVMGGAGFLGSHLCDRLIQKGNTVICLDDLSTGCQSNIDHLIGNPHFIFINHDVTQPMDLDQKLDEIYNLACPASPIHYQNDAVKTVKTNVLGALLALELAKKNNAKVFQSSTSEVYGDPLVHPQKETYWGNVNPIGIVPVMMKERDAQRLYFSITTALMERASR